MSANISHGAETMRDAVIRVCCAVEGNYVPHSAAMLHSVLEQHEPGEVEITYLHPPEFPRDVVEPLEKMVRRGGGEISFVEVPDRWCDGLPIKGYTRKATWYRVVVSEVLESVDRVLFLDSDLVAMGGLRPLWETDLRDCYLGAVANVLLLEQLPHIAELGLDAPQSYFNAGVMLMDLERMRRDGCSAEIVRFAQANHDRLAFRDQDALNVVLADRWHRLHPRWNCMSTLMYCPWAAYVFGSVATNEARTRPSIRHYEGPGRYKPWHRDFDQAHGEEYFRHRRQTPWPIVTLESTPMRERMRHTLDLRTLLRPRTRLKTARSAVANVWARARARLRS